MPTIFKCKTREGYSFKILAELLQNNIKTACFEIDENGIKLRMMDHHKTILIDLVLDSNKFSVYKYKSSQKMFLGINLNHLHKMLKSIKKRDSIELFIDDTSPTDLGIKVIPKENNRITTSKIKIQAIQNLDIDLPQGYSRPVIVPSGEFQKTCKGLTHISNQTHISSKGFLVRFSSDAAGVMERFTDFGENEVSDSENENEPNDEHEYNEEFDTEQLSKITKLAGLSANIQIYTKNGNPLLIKSDVGSLGYISIYLKSKNLQQMESQQVESDDD